LFSRTLLISLVNRKLNGQFQSDCRDYKKFEVQKMIQNLSIPSVQAATFYYYVALLTLGALLLALLVVLQRVATKTNCGDGGHAGLAEMIRVHGNDVENVPFGPVLLIMLAVTDPLGRCMSSAYVWSCGALPTPSASRDRANLIPAAAPA
jgi:uncharacterized membrane protein YecN with MAPEG domain